MKEHTKKKWTTQEEDFLKENYQSKGPSFCCSSLNRSEKSVKGKALGLNLTKKKGANHRYIPYFDSIKEEMIDDYVNKKLSCIKIGKKINADPSIIRKYLMKNGVQIRKKGYRRHFNENYFENIDTEAKAYFLGLLLADGCVYYSKSSRSRQPAISLGLHEKDKDIIEKFAKELELETPIAHRKRNNRCGRNNADQYNIKIASTKMANDLAKLKMTPRKSFNCDFPEIRPDLVRHLIRGIFCGDGCISIFAALKGSGRMSQNFSIVGSEIMCRKIKEILEKELNLTSLSIHKQGNIYKVHCYDRISVLTIFNYLYFNSKFFLKRKFDKFHDIVNYLQDRISNYRMDFSNKEEKELFFSLIKKSRKIINDVLQEFQNLAEVAPPSNLMR